MKNPNTENANISTKGLNILKMRGLIEESFPKIRTTNGESIILVIGNTGAGKSTTINYLRDIVLEEKKVDGAKCIDVKDPASEKDAARIGHEVKSETFYPALYKHKYFNYLDTPGFAENRSKEESVCAILNTRSSIKIAKEIKSAVVVVDKNSLLTERGASFRKLVVTLSGLFKRPSEALDSILFVITKTSREDDISAIQADALKHKKRVFEEFKRVNNMSKDEIEKLPEDERKEREETIQMTQSQLEILDFLGTHPQNIVLIDLFDHCGIYRLTSEKTLLEVKKEKKYNYSYIFVDSSSPSLYYKTDNDLIELKIKNPVKFVKILKLVCGKDFSFCRLDAEQIEEIITEYTGHLPEKEVSKKEIRKFVAEAQNIAKDKFDYTSKDEDYRKFIDVLSDIISEWSMMVEDKAAGENANKTFEKEKTDCDISAANYTKQIDDIKNGKIDKETTINNIKDTIEKNKQSIKSAEDQIDTLKAEIIAEESKKAAELASQQESELYRTDSMHVDATRIDPPCSANDNCWVHHHSERRFYFSDLPLSRIEKSLPFVTSGQWHATTKARHGGREPVLAAGYTLDDFGGYEREIKNIPNTGHDTADFVHDYNSGCGFLGDISIKYYVQKKYIPKYKSIIAAIEKKISDKKAEVSRLKDNITKLEKENLVSEGLIKSIESNITTAQDNIPVLQESLDRINSDIQALKKKIQENSKKIKQLEINIQKNIPLCKIVEELLDILGLSANYKEFIAYLKRYGVNMNDNSANHKNTAKDEKPKFADNRNGFFSNDNNFSKPEEEQFEEREEATP